MLLDVDRVHGSRYKQIHRFSGCDCISKSNSPVYRVDCTSHAGDKSLADVIW